MIQFRLPIDGLYNSVTRPVSISIINDIKDILYIDHDVRSKLANAIDEYITNEQYDPINLEFNSNRVEDIHFSVEEAVNEETLITAPLKYNEYKPIVYDGDVKAMIRPIYVDTNLTFNIKYRSRSKTSINNMLNSLRLKIADNQGITLHNISYMFYLKPELVELFLDIAKLKNNVVPQQGGFEDYLINNTDGRVSIVGGLDGNTKTMDIGVKETQLKINGYFMTDVVSIKGEYGADTGMWEAQLTYNISYNKPTALYVEYPPLIYNQLLPKKYLLTKPGKMVSNSTKANTGYDTTATNTNMETFIDNDLTKRAQYLEEQINGKMFNIPSFDTFIHPAPAPSYAPVFSTLIAISNDDKQSLFNLGELPNISIAKTFIDFIKETEYRYMNRAYNSMFYIELIDDDGVFKGGSIICDKDLNVSSVEELDIRKTYRVIFSIVTDLMMLNSNAISRTLSNHDVYNEVMVALEIGKGDYRTMDRDSKMIMYNKPTKDIPYTVMIGTILSYIGKI